MTAFFPTNRSHGSLHLQSAGGLLPYTPTTALTAFDRTVLPLHARTDYLLAYAFCAFQRFTMIRLSDLLVEYSDKAIRAPARRTRAHSVQPKAAGAPRDMIELERRLLEFTSRGVLAELSQSQHHHAYYRVRAAVQPDLAVAGTAGRVGGAPKV